MYIYIFFKLVFINHLLIVFKIPLTSYDDLQSLISRFWKGGGVDDNKIHLIRWSKLCKPKAEGGWGSRTYRHLIVRS